MSLSANKRLLLAKIETTYGEDSLPTGADALMVSNLDVSPAEAETTERDLIRPFYGQSERLMTQISGKCGFEIELAGHSGGVVGCKPKIDAILRSCGFHGQQVTRSVTEITRVGSVATATIGVHGYKVGNKIKISGSDQAEYNGVKVVTVVTGTTFSFSVTGTPQTPATGTILMNEKYVYTPISSDIPSSTFYYNVDGVLHKITGSKGTFGLDIKSKSIPKIKFDFTGLNNDSADSVAPIPDFSDFTIPQVANTQNTTDFSLLGYGAALESLGITLNNEVTYRSLIGKEYVEVLNRKVSGNMSFEAVKTSDKNYWQTIKDQTTGELQITHGTEPGNIVKIASQRVLLDSPKYSESNNVMMMSVGVSILPVSGNDEITITFE